MAQARRVNEKHQAAINEMMKEARADIGAAARVEAQSVATTKASMNNQTLGAITFQERKDWSGKVMGTYPPNVVLNRTGQFTHRGTPPSDLKGSKGAVVYLGTNVQGGPNNCAWLLAWDVPGDGSPNKIYVEAGPSSKYPSGSINWDDIQGKLDASSNSSYYHDDDTNAEASAQIDNGNTVAVAAVFGVAI